MLFKSILAVAATVGFAAAQVHTDCQPLNKTCPPDPAFGTDHTFYFNSTPNGGLWETTAGVVQFTADKGAEFTISKQGDSPTLRTKFYFFFGRTEIWLKVAPGQGIVSSMMWLSDDLDEVDWEFLGSNKTFANTNYFGKGNEDFHNGNAYPMEGMQDDYHNYTTLWTKENLQWFIDGRHVRTLTAQDANNTKNYPQTPMRMSVGIWAGGDPSLPKGTREWAGGDTDYAHGPYSMYLKSAQVTDFSSGKEYTYGDRSGSWESIKVADGNSTAVESLNQTPPKTMSEKWADLPTGAKAGIYAGGGVVALAAISTLAWYFIRQRRIGSAEAKAAQEKEEMDRRENEQLQRNGINPDSFAEHGREYNASEMRRDGMADNNSYHVPETNPFSGPFDDGSRLGSSASNASFGAGAGAAGSMRSIHSQRGTPGPRYDYAAPPPVAQSPVMRSHSPAGSAYGMPPARGQPQYQMRSGSAPPMRTASPGPPQRGYTMQNIQSPQPMRPQRNFTDYGGGYSGQGGQGGWGDRGQRY